MIEIKNLVKRYGDLVALDHLNLEVSEGEVFGLLGPNGCGKTTAISCLLALLKYDKGEITIFGKEMHPDSYDMKRKIGIVPQEVAVFEELTVAENIDYFCGLYVKDKAQRKECVEQAIDFVGLENHRKMRPKQLSGGLLRRLNIACGIAHKPELIILDEPTVAVDPQSRNHILEGIQRLNKEGATIIYTSHYIASGTKEELKRMIKTGERITIEGVALDREHLQQIRELPHVFQIDYKNQKIVICCSSAKQNLMRVLHYLQENEISFGKIFSEMPTLNDVFLEITGKELRD